MVITQEMRSAAESLALADYQRVAGQEITISMVSGYNGADDCIDVDGVTVRVRVLDTPESDLKHWVDEYLDPYWNVEPLEIHPSLEGLRSFWTFGPSYLVANGKVVAVDNNQSVSHGK